MPETPKYLKVADLGGPPRAVADIATGFQVAGREIVEYPAEDDPLTRQSADELYRSGALEEASAAEFQEYQDTFKEENQKSESELATLATRVALLESRNESKHGFKHSLPDEDLEFLGDQSQGADEEEQGKTPHHLNAGEAFDENEAGLARRERSGKKKSRAQVQEEEQEQRSKQKSKQGE